MMNNKEITIKKPGIQEKNNKTEKSVLVEGLVYILLVSWFPYKKWYL